MSRAPMTKTGAERLRGELERLKSVDRPRIIAAIAEARAHGDLKENAEYHAAKDEQGMMESRIRKIQHMLRDPDIVEAPEAADAVGAGLLVTVKPLDFDDEVVYEAPGGTFTYRVVSFEPFTA